MRWGTALHDQFMLPHFVWEDFLDVLGDLRPRRLRLRAGMVRGAARIPLPARRRGRAWRRASGDPQALEPWHVMGEEGAQRRHGALRRFLGRAAAGQGARASCRAATSSPATDGALPMTGTGVTGEAVAGVRFKAWQPPSGLHPTVAVHAPLTFDIIDSWSSALARRLRLSRGPSGRPQLRHLPGQRLRGRGAAAGALSGSWPYART